MLVCTRAHMSLHTYVNTRIHSHTDIVSTYGGRRSRQCCQCFKYDWDINFYFCSRLPWLCLNIVEMLAWCSKETTFGFREIWRLLDIGRLPSTHERLSLSLSLYIYIYIYMCVCVCVCVCVRVVGVVLEAGNFFPCLLSFWIVCGTMLSYIWAYWVRYRGHGVCGYRITCIQPWIEVKRRQRWFLVMNECMIDR